ncbi:MAG TPA: right-handed parallel beta-helix repeat-containing protein, partial [Candidatus Limnocylindrales bacterium]
SDPAGHAVEVTTRARWLQISASDVTVDGLTFRDAGNGPQAEDAALRISGGSERFALARSHLLVAHGALLGLVGGVGHRVLDSELGWAGQEGFGIAGVADTLIARTYIHDNNTDDFEPGWEAGAGKASRSTGLTFDGNTVSNNRGPGLWCDIACESVTYVGNRVDHNENAGIFYEISTAGDIRSNVVFENGWGRVDWGWGAGILVSSSGSTDVADNTVAWNADGITVVSQPRPDRPAAAGTGISVHDNAVIGAPQPGDNGDAFLVAWLQDGDGPLYRPDSHNDGGDNEFWSSAAEPAGERFHWALGASTLEAFASTPGGRGGRYLSLGERNAVLSAAGAPLGPEQRLVHVAPTRRELVTFGLGGLGLVGIAVLGGIVLWRRRRAAGGRARSASPS